MVVLTARASEAPPGETKSQGALASPCPLPAQAWGPETRARLVPSQWPPWGQAGCRSVIWDFAKCHDRAQDTASQGTRPGLSAWVERGALGRVSLCDPGQVGWPLWASVSTSQPPCRGPVSPRDPAAMLGGCPAATWRRPGQEARRSDGSCRGPRNVREDASRRLGPVRRVAPAFEASSSGPDTGVETGRLLCAPSAFLTHRVRQPHDVVVGLSLGTLTHSFRASAGRFSVLLPLAITCYPRSVYSSRVCPCGLLALGTGPIYLVGHRHASTHHTPWYTVGAQYILFT